MKIKMISSLMLAGLVAFGAQAEDFTGSIYIKDATIAPGGTAILSVQMENNIPIRGFDLTLTLPDGVTVIDWSLSEDRLPDGITPDDKMDMPVNEGSKFKWPCTLLKGSQLLSFKDTSGEIATLTIKAEPTALEDTYTIVLTNIVVSEPEGNDFHVDDSDFQLTVKAPTYEDGYSVEILPFALTDASTFPFLIDNETNINAFEFDVVLPPSILSELYDGITFDLSRFDTDAKNNNGTIHVTASSTRRTIAAGSGTTCATLKLYYEEGLVETGIYPILIKNITMTDEGGNSYMAAPYTTEIFVGNSPKATATDGVAAFHGNYGGVTEFALLKAALPTGATIDLTEVSAMAEDATTLKTDNVIVTADAVAYGRTVSNEWGTLCLPFAVESDDNIQLYEMSGASSESLSFEKVSSAAANTPLVFKATGGFSIKTTNDGTFDVGFAAANPKVSITPSVTNWVVNGSFIDESIDVSSLQAYALSGGQFHRATSKINVKAFRAWFQNNGAPMGAAIRIEEGTDGIDFVEQEDGSVKLFYDMQGRLLKNGEQQQMYIENGKKVISINK
jgi:hypothetical protein